LVLSSGDEIGSTEIVALEKQRFASSLRQRISKAISEVQTGGMTPFAEQKKGPPSNLSLLKSDGLNTNRCFPRRKASQRELAIEPIRFSITIANSTRLAALIRQLSDF
jgi:hypothetical protein